MFVYVYSKHSRHLPPPLALALLKPPLAAPSFAFPAPLLGAKPALLAFKFLFPLASKLLAGASLAALAFFIAQIKIRSVYRDQFTPAKKSLNLFNRREKIKHIKNKSAILRDLNINPL